MTDSAADWYRHSFADDYLRIYRHRDHAEASRALSALLGLVTLPSSPRCLDLGCGAGRHMVAMRRHGIRAVGLDLSAVMLREAVHEPEVGRAVVRGDMRRLPFRPGFDAVFSFFTSFGYFDDDAVNLGVLRQIAGVLKPRGAWLLDYLNPAYVQAHLVPEDHETFPDFELRQRRWIDAGNQSVDKELVVTDTHGRRTYRERVKLYGEAWFRDACREAGLAIDRVLGDYQASPYSADSPRLILIGHREAPQ